MSRKMEQKQQVSSIFQIIRSVSITGATDVSNFRMTYDTSNTDVDVPDPLQTILDTMMHQHMGQNPMRHV